MKKRAGLTTTHLIALLLLLVLIIWVIIWIVGSGLGNLIELDKCEKNTRYKLKRELYI